MSDARTLAWLAELQGRFGALLRTPLDRQSGNLRAPTETYDLTLCGETATDVGASARERLAVYHRQYWFRLFTTLQREYPLTARFIGMWHFNELAADYLGHHPPGHFDLAQIAPAFAPYLTSFLEDRGSYQSVPRALLLEACTLDRAFARVFLAPEVELLDAAQLSLADFAEVRLLLAPSVALFCESWPLVELRGQVLTALDQERVTAPAQLSEVQYWVIFRRDSGHRALRLDPLAHLLYSELARSTAAEALARVEAACPPDQRAALPGRVQHWLRDSVRIGFWAKRAV